MGGTDKGDLWIKEERCSPSVIAARTFRDNYEDGMGDGGWGGKEGKMTKRRGFPLTQ